MIKTPNFVICVSLVAEKVIGRMRDRSHISLKFKTLWK
ncbi:MAG: hypothetical protein HW419_2285 [Deltaproteobacteria bacterium]|nr:hypothetical protein [Deltaproteobacteria bacterium]